MFDLGLILSLAQACVPQAAPETLAAIAWVESRFNPIAIGVNHGPRPAQSPRSPAEAVVVARELLARGANLDLGLAQINSDNLDWLNLSVEDAFDPCRNLAAAGAVLAAGYRPAGGDDPQTALRVALSRYNTGHPARGIRNGYVARVERAALDLGLARRATVRPSGPPPHIVVRPEPTPPAWDVFGRAATSPILAFRAPARPGDLP